MLKYSHNSNECYVFAVNSSMRNTIIFYRLFTVKMASYERHTSSIDHFFKRVFEVATVIYSSFCSFSMIMHLKKCHSLKYPQYGEVRKDSAEKRTSCWLTRNSSAFPVIHDLIWLIWTNWQIVRRNGPWPSSFEKGISILLGVFSS